ncbi:alpha-2-macroglobulin family protein [Leptospira licerasiae]|uniref:Alpha-2-macroglobulin family protein n=1 Tax=Leptospira licerasiae str. MMD4847 TaxID=1049971 RepID=A0ABP2RFM9_9LEPT|nr:alpha-2-macroglobulin family protein [Leptospira licerasiae]EIE02554.1 MG2 domain / alpha-2-macroglobulin family / alpha-2-macroglobulin family / alpha-macro-globulin thiol-ester bond-forming region multi-domain protein [Leptospira licerasiae serovar Varillal str. VAR 010]EJZ43153.1 alpha-2-macroglobulin family protein [Leptospira licerasiae str. MMD4847]
MRTRVSDRKKIIFSFLAILISALGLFYVKPNLFGSAAFYLGTDRSFGSGENAYVNLEGNGTVNYEFRVYKIADPQAFLTKKVKERLVQENNDGAFGNPVALFTRTVDKFRNDFRKVARKEFNSKTRSELKKTLGIDYEKPNEEKTLAIPAILKDQELVATFSVPTVTSFWAYRRIPVPIRDNGVYLVEGVSGSQLAYTILIKSGLNFLVKQSDAETFVYVGRKDSGEPVSDVDLTLFNLENGQAFQTGKTSSDGTYFYKGRSPVKGLVLAHKNGEYSVSDPEFYSSSFYGEGGPRAYMYTDRPVYRPGDTVYFKGIVRNFSQDDYRTISGAGVVAVASEQGETSIPSIPINISGDNGTFSGEFVVPESESTTLGNYSLILNFRDKTFQTEFAVEAYKKPTFLVSVSVPKSNYLQKEEVNALVKARYYYGQPVAGQGVAYRVFRRPKFDYSPVGTINFDASSDYLEQSGQNDKQELVLDGKGKLDSKGQYSISFKPDKSDADSVYTIIASVQSEDMTLDGSASFSVNRSAFFVRISKDNSVYEPGKEAKLTVSLIAYDKTLSEVERQKMVGNRNVDLILYNRDIQFVREANRSKISSLSVMTSASGVGTASFTIPKRGQFVLVAETKDPSGNLTKSETFFWASSVSDSIEIPFKDITLKPGKDIYSVGDTAEILVLSPVSNGHMILTLEGNRIFKKEVVKMKGNALKYAVPITAEMSPNFTLSAVQFSGNDVYKSQVRVVAPPEQKFLKVALESGRKVYRPGDKAEIKLKTTGLGGGGVSAEVSLAIVDEAIYQIKEEKTPNIGTFFYHPRRNNVQTTLASAYKFFGYSENKRLKLALGKKGDSVYSAMKNEDQARDRFKDTSYWNAKVKTGPDGTATVSFNLPDNLTSWRVTAIAITPDTKVGKGQTSFVTKKDLMILGGIPRFIIKGETQKVSATISNQSPSKLPIKVTVKAEGAKIIGNSETTINLEPGQNQSLHFDVQTVVDPKVKSAKISILAAGAGYQDLLKSEIPLKTWGLPKTISDSLGMEEGEHSGVLSLEAPKELGDPRLEVRLSPASLPALRQSLDYLADYPYGCVEQTMSRFYPLLSAQKAGFINERLRKELPKMIDVGLKRVAELQRTDGGFGWFEGGVESDVLMSAYVYRGLAVSQKNGAKVSAPVLNRARAYLYDVLGKGDLSPNVKAYIIFSLSEGGNVEDSIVDGLVKSSAKLNQYGQALLSLTLANKGKKAEASTWFKKGIETSGFGKKPFFKLTSYGKNPRWEEDRIETISALLSAGVRLGEDKVVLSNLASSLLSNRIELAWNNSRDTSAAVLALSEFLSSIRESETPANVEIVLNGTSLKTVILPPKSEQGELYKIPIPSELIRSGPNKVEVLKKDGPVLYATASLYYTDRSKKIQAYSNGIKVKRTYYKLKVDSNDITPVESKTFQPGDLVMVEVSVQKEGDVDSYYQIEDSLLPGFSFLQKDAEYYAGDLKMEYLSRQVYDDKAVFFVGGPTKEFKVRYFIRAEVGGKYKVIPARASLMYYSEVTGASSDDEINVGQ